MLVTPSNKLVVIPVTAAKSYRSLFTQAQHMAVVIEAVDKRKAALKHSHEGTDRLSLNVANDAISTYPSRANPIATCQCFDVLSQIEIIDFFRFKWQFLVECFHKNLAVFFRMNMEVSLVY